MADNNIGKLLHSMGWSQGALLPAMQWSVLYCVDDPVTSIAKAAKRQDESNQRKAGTDKSPALRERMANGPMRESDYLVIVSQECDLVKSLSEEPTVLAMRTFCTENEKILRAAGGNSIRYFLLDRGRNLVVESSISVLIEKPVLANFTPIQGSADPLVKRRFAKWVARRFDRPAIADEVIGAVVKPILDNLRSLQEKNDPVLITLEAVEEIRMAQLTGEPPYDVRAPVQAKTAIALENTKELILDLAREHFSAPTVVSVQKRIDPLQDVEQLKAFFRQLTHITDEQAIPALLDQFFPAPLGK